MKSLFLQCSAVLHNVWHNIFNLSRVCFKVHCWLVVCIFSRDRNAGRSYVCLSEQCRPLLLRCRQCTRKRSWICFIVFDNVGIIL